MIALEKANNKIITLNGSSNLNFIRKNKDININNPENICAIKLGLIYIKLLNFSKIFKI